jgi:hypothetical protein
MSCRSRSSAVASIGGPGGPAADRGGGRPPVSEAAAFPAPHRPCRRPPPPGAFVRPVGGVHGVRGQGVQQRAQRWAGRSGGRGQMAGPVPFSAVSASNSRRPGAARRRAPSRSRSNAVSTGPERGAASSPDRRHPGRRSAADPPWAVGRGLEALPFPLLPSGRAGRVTSRGRRPWSFDSSPASSPWPFQPRDRRGEPFDRFQASAGPAEGVGEPVGACGGSSAPRRVGAPGGRSERPPSHTP